VADGDDAALTSNARVGVQGEDGMATVAEEF
jgi:hypothetical protein